MLDERAPGTCKAVCKNGQPCRVPALPGAPDQCCFAHSIVTLEKRTRCRSENGKRRMRPRAIQPGAPEVRFSSSEDVLAFLERVATAVLRGQLDPVIGTSLRHVGRVALQAISQSVLEKRIAALEAKGGQR